ncbi:MAG TPA: sn-glycerol-3-phosphate ABC transporter ATP-binding protein UgpC [Hyphomicrobiaceae bacterium]|nr:sn-glycerol-3-phosphate ABC transporter ATP-binding protein UgpC [Hyphomicrobiaceae bacterium]
MAVVALEKLTKFYDRGQLPAADAVSLEVRHGEFMVLLGPSGCGKTTTLRMIAGLESISSGTLAIDGRVVNHVPAKDRDIAMVFQSYALYPHMSVADNLAFGLKRRSVDPAEIGRRVAAVADTLGLTGLLKRKPHALSGGQRQRVALGRAIVRDPKVFLFDEPLSNLDASLRVSTRGEISKLHRRLGATMIYVTHDQVEAMTLGQRICIMNGGRIAQVGAPLEVYKHPINTFVASFLGNPPMNLLSARVEGKDPLAVRLGGELLELKAWQYPALPLGAAITLGIRPENIAEHTGAGASERFVGLAAEIVQIESLGAETILAARIAGIESEVVARVGPETAARVGERRSLLLDLSAIHLFDATGAAIAQEARAANA